jgi:hypothetical protein
LHFRYTLLSLRFAHPHITQHMRFAPAVALPYFLPLFSDKIIRKRAKNIAYTETLSEIFFNFYATIEKDRRG